MHIDQAKVSADASRLPDLLTCRQCSTLIAEERTDDLTPRFANLQAAFAPQDLPNWRVAALAAASKKASDIRVLDLRDVTSFTDFFIICTTTNPRQGHAICEEVEKQLKSIGERPVSIEGYDPAEWILMDYGDFLVHIFSESARSYYDLERLWRHGKLIGDSQSIA